MSPQQNSNTINDLIYLCGCAVRMEVPDKKRAEELDLDMLYKAADAHMLTSAVAFALESAGINDTRFSQAKWKAIRKIALLDADRKNVFARFEEEGIWYMPLKGVVLKELYPKFGMRQMSDNDIYFDKTRTDDVRQIMVDLGFTVEHFGKFNHDVYYKKPVSNFEMHRELFPSIAEEKIYNYYTRIDDHMLKDEHSKYGRRLSNEDFYLFIISHEYKHFSGGGTGLRSLLDTYVFLNKYSDLLDMDYISAECEKLGIQEFEKNNRILAQKLFSGEELDDKEKEMFGYFISSGVYGNIDFYVENKVNKLGGGKQGKLRFIMSGLFMPMETVKCVYPFFYRHKILLPALFFYRLGKALTVSRGMTINKLKKLRKI